MLSHLDNKTLTSDSSGTEAHPATDAILFQCLVRSNHVTSVSCHLLTFRHVGQFSIRIQGSSLMVLLITKPAPFSNYGNRCHIKHPNIEYIIITAFLICFSIQWSLYRSHALNILQHKIFLSTVEIPIKGKRIKWLYSKNYDIVLSKRCPSF